MQFINNLYHSAQNYYQQIPANTGKQMVYNAGVAFVINVIFCSHLNQGIDRGITSAAVTLTATAIYGLVSPLFKAIFDTSQLDTPMEALRTFTAIAGASYIAAAILGNRSIVERLTTSMLYWGLFIILEGESRGDLNRTQLVGVLV